MKRFIVAACLLASLHAIGSAFAEKHREGIRVGITEMPPYVMIHGSDVYGLSNDLWINLADSLDIPYTYIRFGNYLELMEAVDKGDVDLTINPITLTDSRLENFRLTIPFYTSRLALAQRPPANIPIAKVFLSILNWRTFKLILLLCSIVLVFAVLMWLAERRKNTVEFRKGFSGVVDGIWWAFVTMTTVGYGDKVPRTRLGRMLTLIWMFYAIALLFIFTAEISSELTVTKLQGDIDTVDELRKIRLGTMEQTGFASFCRINRIQYTPYTDLMEGLKSIRERKIEGFVADIATLDYAIEKFKMGADLVIIPSTLNEQFFCFAANRNHLYLIDEINPVMLNITESAEWVEILYKNGVKQ